ncbi:MAG: hypothetical protein BGO98_34510 [Myxococcales bacterium 68-20]|nr:MAG: hypothetical protein BGO98_34510 [Myxococcales bacterium 68-20]
MHYPDLGTECQIARGPRVRAVGWLAAGLDFGCGEIDGKVVEVLTHLREEGWVHIAMPGIHECELCHQAREARNILVPSRDVLYVAPAMVIHYIAEHAYLPPSEFCAAVLGCPAPTTDAYYEELRRFIDVYSVGHPVTAADFDRSTRAHREWREQIAANRRADAERKRFTW